MVHFGGLGREWKPGSGAFEIGQRGLWMGRRWERVVAKRRAGRKWCCMVAVVWSPSFTGAPLECGLYGWAWEQRVAIHGDWEECINSRDLG